MINMLLRICLFLPLSVFGPALPGIAGSLDASANIFASAYPDADISLKDGPEGTFLVIESRFIPLTPAGGCPAVSPQYSGDPPLCATLFPIYAPGPEGRYPDRGIDPGRLRNETFLKLLYGATAREVEQNCVTVDFLGEQVRMNARHGAARALARVAEKLERLTVDHPEIREYALPTAGAYFWRTIKNSGRLSAHSFGIAFDLNKDNGPYWLWNPSPAVLDSARQNYPQAIVDAFESEGFIWGGKWHSFDLMHFEYRPEFFQGR